MTKRRDENREAWAQGQTTNPWLPAYVENPLEGLLLGALFAYGVGVAVFGLRGVEAVLAGAVPVLLVNKAASYIIGRVADWFGER